MIDGFDAWIEPTGSAFQKAAVPTPLFEIGNASSVEVILSHIRVGNWQHSYPGLVAVSQNSLSFCCNSRFRNYWIVYRRRLSEHYSRQRNVVSGRRIDVQCDTDPTSPIRLRSAMQSGTHRN